MSSCKYPVWLLVVFCLLSTVSAAPRPSLPDEWRYPSPEELKGNFIREQSGQKFIEVSADFNGDGVVDSAFLVKSTEFSGEAIIVNVSVGSEFEWNVLNVITWGEEYPNVNLAMGVEVIPPGVYKTACGKGYWICKDDEVPLLTLELPAISYFRFESAASFFYWSQDSESFKRIWISD